MPAPEVDIIENTLRQHGDFLELLLVDRTRTTARKVHHILWATDSYVGHSPKSEISVADITGVNTYLIQPRIAKSKDEQKRRSQDKAEVFTPREIVARMNQLVDWNTANWPADKDNWQAYVAERRLEITCGEAPFIVGRYNAANGKKVLKLAERVGFLDRKLQTVSKFAPDRAAWLKWATVAYQSSYGYEWQGDNLLLARENLLYTFVDYWNEQFPDDPIDLLSKLKPEHLGMLSDIAYIISWNIFQMDGIKNTVPMTGEAEPEEEPPLLSLAAGKKLPAGKSDSAPIYAKIMDWQTKRPLLFNSLS